MAQIVTITNPLTGQPAQVDQLEHTAQQIDDGLNIVRGVSNPNLLDNWYFGNPVDQRGGYVVPTNTPYHAIGDGVTIVGYTTKYETVGALHYADSSTGKMWYCLTGDMSNYTITNDYIVRGYTGAVMTIDRWKNLGNGGGAGVVIINDGYVSFHNDANWIQVQQIIDLDLTGKTVTLSALKNDGELITATNVASTSFFYAGNLSGFYITFLISNNKSVVNIMNKLSTDVGVKAVKLELGSQQTLAHQDANGNWQLNEIPDFGEQLARCQRYFQLYSSADLRPAKAVDCRPTMRADPSQSTIVVNSTTYYYNTADL